VADDNEHIRVRGDLSVLGVADAETSFDDAGVVVPVSFCDWTIDGVALRNLLGVRPPQEMTLLTTERFVPGTAADYVRRLLGHAAGQLPDGRVAVLLCPIDGDVGCGTVSARLHIGDRTVEWCELGWQTDYQAFTNEDVMMPGFTFGREQYERLLNDLLNRFQ
jgi:hypothetical protein